MVASRRAWDDPVRYTAWSARYDAFMANWDLVVPYDTRATTFLAKEGLPHPHAIEGNRSPTVRELKSVDATGVWWDVRETGDDEIVDHLRMRGHTLEAELRAVYAIAAICGQQWVYPDSGAPSLVVDPAIDFRRTLDVWAEANQREDGWEWLYRELYSS